MRDRDGDGYLSRREYGGTRDEFQKLDRDTNGLIGAADLVREALERSPQLAEMVSGRWSPIYNRIMNVDEPLIDTLLDAVHEGADAVHEAQLTQSIEQPAPASPDEPNPETSTRSDLASEFLSHNPDLPAVYRRLQELADRLGRNYEYTPVDLLA